MSEPYDPRVEHLAKLGMALLARGVHCELAATGCVPRLRLDIPCLGGFDNAAFEDNIVAADEPDGIWRYWWPWAQPIAAVEDIAQVVDHICRNAGPGDGEDDGPDGGENDGPDDPARETAERMLRLTGLRHP